MACSIYRTCHQLALGGSPSLLVLGTCIVVIYVYSNSYNTSTYMYTYSLAIVGLHWPALAFVDCRWPAWLSWACAGLRWLSLVFIGLRWLSVVVTVHKKSNIPGARDTYVSSPIHSGCR